LHTAPRTSQQISPGAQLSALEQAKSAPGHDSAGSWHEPEGPAPPDDEEVPPDPAHVESETPSTESLPVHRSPFRQSVFLSPGSAKQTCAVPGQLFAHTVPTTAVALPGHGQVDASPTAPPFFMQQTVPAEQTLPEPHPISPAQMSGTAEGPPASPPELVELPPLAGAGVQPVAAVPEPEPDDDADPEPASPPMS
jgi:hypothetical protein